jgi:hypothetical protein
MNLIIRLTSKLAQMEASFLKKQEYIVRLTQAMELQKKENNELHVIIEKKRMESEREINAREIENNDLRKRLESILKNPKLKYKGKTVLVNYTELKNEPELKEEEIKSKFAIKVPKLIFCLFKWQNRCSSFSNHTCRVTRAARRNFRKSKNQN